MYLGHGAYGVEAASRLYFSKSNKQLTLEEAALIAGIFQTPERQSPFVDMKRATARRNIVLQRMADERYITQAQADAAKAKPIVTRGQPNQPPGIAPFFVEEVRKHLEQQYGAKVLYENGLSVTTTLDVKLQEAANRAIEPGLRRYDKRHGWRRPARNVIAEHQTIDTFKDDRWNRPIAAGDIVPAVVVTAPKTGAARVRLGRSHADLGPGGLRLDPADVRGRSVQAGRSHRRARHQGRRRACDRDGDARADAARGGRACRHRQPHRPDQRDGRRLELQPQQVQPRGAGVPAARIDVQADRLHGGDRSRLHAGVDPHRRAGQLSGRARTDLQPAELRPQVRRARHAAPRARGVAQHSRDQDDGGARTQERAGLREAVRLRRRTFRPICRSRSAPATPRCSRSRAPTRCFRIRACG